MKYRTKQTTDSLGFSSSTEIAKDYAIVARSYRSFYAPVKEILNQVMAWNFLDSEAIIAPIKKHSRPVPEGSLPQCQSTGP